MTANLAKVMVLSFRLHNYSAVHIIIDVVGHNDIQAERTYFVSLFVFQPYYYYSSVTLFKIVTNTVVLLLKK